MKVFLSWSGERARRVATALHGWLPLVINAVEPFISSDIDAGARWQSDVAAELEETDFGIVCVTAENQGAPWLNFEAGALAKKVGAGRVVPLAIDLRPAEILLPLAQFQAQPLTQSGMAKIVSTINSFLPKPLPNEHVEKAMDMWWPELESEVQKIDHELSQGVVDVPVRSERELLEDILNTVRSLVRSQDPVLIDPQPYMPESEDEVVQRAHRSSLAKWLKAAEPMPSFTIGELLNYINQQGRQVQPPAHDKSLDE